MKRLVIGFCVSICLLSTAAQGSSGSAEYHTKADFLFNFIKFITWPSTNLTQFNVCILGEDAFGPTIDAIKDRTAFKLPIRLLKLRHFNAIQSCQIVFISAKNQANFIDQAIRQAQQLGHILMVGEGEQFARRQGMIAFVMRDGKIKLQINLKALQQSGLAISAKLLEVAELVGDSGHE